MLLVDRTDGVVTLTLNRPEAMNALDVDAQGGAPRRRSRRWRPTASCRAVVLAGAGRAFCVGQDLREHVGVAGLRRAPTRSARSGAHYNPIASTAGQHAQAGRRRGRAAWRPAPAPRSRCSPTSGSAGRDLAS